MEASRIEGRRSEPDHKLAASTAWLAVITATTLPPSQLQQVVGHHHAQLGPERQGLPEVVDETGGMLV